VSCHIDILKRGYGLQQLAQSQTNRSENIKLLTEIWLQTILIASLSHALVTLEAAYQPERQLRLWSRQMHMPKAAKQRLEAPHHIWTAFSQGTK
jgi:hypothetical protein